MYFDEKDNVLLLNRFDEISNKKYAWFSSSEWSDFGVAIKYIFVKNNYFPNVCEMNAQKESFYITSLLTLHHYKGTKAKSSFCEAEKFYNENPHWTFLDSPPYPISSFVSQTLKLPTRIYVNEIDQRAVILTQGASEINVFDTLAPILPRILTWVYKGELDEEDKVFFKALQTNDKCTVKTILQNLSERINLKYELNLLRLKGRNLRRWNKLLTSKKEALKVVEEKLQSLYKQLENASAIYSTAALEVSPTSDSFYEYNLFKSHVLTEVLDVNDEYIEYGVSDFIKFYDEYIVEKNLHSYSTAFGKRIRDLFEEIFIKHSGKIKCSAIFRLYEKTLSPIIGDPCQQRSDAKAVTVYGNVTTEKKSIFHPHIYHHACIGGSASTYISRFLEQGKVDMVVEQTINATQNINFGDAIVVREFAQDIQNSWYNTPFVYINDEEALTPDAFMKKIKGDSYGT